MRTTPTLVLAIALACAVSAPGALAVEVTTESSGDHCSSVSMSNHGTGSGGCVLKGASESQVEFGNPLGMSLCDATFEGRIGEGGAGYLYSHVLTNCALSPCTEAGGTGVWPIGVSGSSPPGYLAELALCYQIGAMRFACHLTALPLSQTSHSAKELVAANGAGHKTCQGSANTMRFHLLMSTDGTHPAFEIAD
jgi:hypothetical protein